MAVFDAADWIWPDVGSGWLLDVNPSSPLAEALLSALTADSAAFGRPAILSSTLAVAPDRRFIGNARVGNGAGVLSAPIPSTTVKQWTLFASFSLSFTNVEKAAAGVGGGSSSPLLSLHHVSNSAKMRVWARNDSGNNPAATVYTSADVFDGLPHDVALIFDGATLRSVVDGVEDATCAWTAGNFTINRHAICGSWRNGAAYNPSLASAYRSLFFDKALSVAEVRELASQDAGGLFCAAFPAGLYLTSAARGVSPTASMSITTDGSMFVASASVNPIASASLTTSESTVSSSATVNPIAVASITTGSATFTSSAVVSAVASSLITTDSAVVSSPSFVSPRIQADVTTDSAVIASSAISSARASGSITTSDAVSSSSVFVNAFASGSLTTDSSTFFGTVGTGAIASASITTDSALVLSSAVVKAIVSGSITSDSSVFSGFAGVGSIVSGSITTTGAVFASSSFVKPIASAGLVTESSLFAGIGETGATASGNITTDASWLEAIAKVNPVALMSVYTDSAVIAGAASSGRALEYWPTPDQVLLGVTYGPTGTEYTGTLIVGPGATVYIEQILSEVVDDQVIVLLQDEVIQSNILSETT